MYKIFLLTILCFSTLYAQQKKFLVTLPSVYNSVLYDVTQNYNQSITAVGFANRYKTRQGSKTYTSAFEYLADNSQNLYGKKTFLITLNTKSATQTQSDFAKIKRFNEGVSVIKTPQNGYFIGGYTFDGDLYVAKLDPFGKVITSKIFGTKNYDRMNKLIPLSDGGVLAVGNSTTSRDLYDPLFKTGLGLNDIFLTRFNQDGTILWSKKYGTEYDDRGIDATEAYDGSIVVIASTTYHKNHDVTLMRIGENGNKIWLHHYKEHKLLMPKRVITLKDNTFLASLVEQDEIGKKQIRLIRFDLQQNIQKDITLNTYYASELNDIKEYANGSIIGVGLTKDRYNTDALVMVLDENLEILCQEHFGGENYDIFNGVSILRNSDAFAVGYTYPDGMQTQHIYMAKIKPNCLLATIEPQKETTDKKPKYYQLHPYSNTKTAHNYYQINPSDNRTKTKPQGSIYDKLLTAFSKEIQNKQIVISKNCTITLTSPTLLFKQGSFTLTTKQKYFLTPFSKKLTQFLSQNLNQIKTLEIIGHTSSEWQKTTDATSTYNLNMQLSLKRSFSVSRFIYATQNSNGQKILKQLLKDSGYSYAKLIKKDAVEDAKESRRVVFRIITN